MRPLWGYFGPKDCDGLVMLQEYQMQGRQRSWLRGCLSGNDPEEDEVTVEGLRGAGQ